MRIGRACIDGVAVFGEIEGEHFHILDDPFSSRQRSGSHVPLEGLTLLSPTQPRTTLLILGGFLPADGTPLPPGTRPRLTPKVTSGLGGDGSEIVVPPFVTGHLWAEVEVAVVIGRELRGASPDEARDAILGYACFNDASAPEFIFDLAERKPLAAPDYFRCKSIDTFGAMGPWIETSLTEQDLADGLQLTTHVNGEPKAGGNTRTAKFPPSVVVSSVSEATTLYPGDVIALGTPQPADVRPGDVVRFEVEGIGSFTNRIVGAR
jgi:2-keto-4-pentenoate hydratase/2-oxohepta-3-ene-1,7-dioic acid hydratase in catechol pathway